MKDGMFVFDAVVHLHDTTKTNELSPIAAVTAGQIQANTDHWGSSKMPPNPAMRDGMTDVEQATRWLFEESDTDMAMAQTVPLLEYWKTGFSPADRQAELARACPGRVAFCGGVDPLFQGIRGAQTEMERQFYELGAKSFKFYQAQSRSVKWAADDAAIAYPLYEKAQELGVTFLQFHKGFPLGDQSMEDLRALDIQRAALDFPDLTFGLHHFGYPYIDETIAVAASRPNVVLVMPLWFNQYMVQPRLMLKILGQALFNIGPERLLYASEGFLWPRLQTFIDMWAELEMPADLQEGYGYPALDRNIKELIFGRNLARILDIDVPSGASHLAPST